MLTRMGAVIAHRGPDDEGRELHGHVALGHRRLSIVDLAAGHQPMSNEDESLWIAFNGEIYNHGALRPLLEAAGHRYRTRSDTETIVHAVEEWGADAFARLRGMFAFALWDRRSATLTLVRDHSGIKPLYYAHLADGSLVFGSEVKAIAAAGVLDLTLNHDVVEEYFATGHVAGARTLLTGVSKLEPGFYLTWQPDRPPRLARYWSIDQVAPAARRVADRAAAPEALAPEFWTRFVDAVASQLMADVPLGVFLSGGLDSSLIVAAMRAAGRTEIESFSVGYREAEASELPWARRVAGHLSTRHHEVLVDGRDFFADLPDLTWHRDFPLTFSASIPLFHLSRLARERVTVVLTGEGSDELFAGYGRYPRALANARYFGRVGRWLPAGARVVVATLAHLGRGRRWPDRVARSFAAADGTAESLMLEPFAEWHGRWRAELLAGTVPQGRPWGSEVLDPTLIGRDPLEALLRFDQRTYMEELLMKQDAMSMAASIESRVPFLDHLLVEWAASLPSAAKLRGGVGKAVVRAAARAHLPRDVVEGPKRGFLVPLDRWLRQEGREVVDTMAAGIDSSLFSRRTVRRLVHEHVGGRDHTGRLWRLLAFECWRTDTLPRLAALGRQPVAAASAVRATSHVGDRA